MDKTLVIWHRYGKEHAANPDDLRANPPELVAEHLDRRLALFRATPDEDWRWWQVNEALVVERPLADGDFYQADTRIYYLIRRGLAVVEAFHFQPPNEDLYWYVHIADIRRDPVRDCWVKQDLFADIFATRDARQPLVIDLDELADALDMKLVTPTQTADILRRTEAVRRAMSRGQFPLAEIEQARAACVTLGWNQG